MKSIRFGLFTSNDRLPYQHWLTTLPKIEKLGYSTILQQDHFETQAYDPIVMLASAAAVTTKLHIGTLVFAVDYRHPVILAKASAALQLISNGRLEFGIGAGYEPQDYKTSGIRYDPARIRVDRLEEAIDIIKLMWTQDKTSYNGKHFKLDGMEKAGDLIEGNLPRIMIGGGGKRMLRLAAHEADIVGIVHQWKGSFGEGVKKQKLDAIKQKIEYVKSNALRYGRDPDEIEFQLLSLWTFITDDPDPYLEELAGYFGISKSEAYESEYVFIGTGSEIKDKVLKILDETDINYFVVSPKLDQIETFSKQVIQPIINNR